MHLWRQATYREPVICVGKRQDARKRTLHARQDDRRTPATIKCFKTKPPAPVYDSQGTSMFVGLDRCTIDFYHGRLSKDNHWIRVCVCVCRLIRYRLSIVNTQLTCTRAAEAHTGTSAHTASKIIESWRRNHELARWSRAQMWRNWCIMEKICSRYELEPLASWEKAAWSVIEETMHVHADTRGWHSWWHETNI
jgi:hypothetical protein